MRQWTGPSLDHILPCRLLFICNSYVYIQENAFEDVVCSMVTIFFYLDVLNTHRRILWNNRNNKNILFGQYHLLTYGFKLSHAGSLVGEDGGWVGWGAGPPNPYPRPSNPLTPTPCPPQPSEAFTSITARFTCARNIVFEHKINFYVDVVRMMCFPCVRLCFMCIIWIHIGFVCVYFKFTMLSGTWWTQNGFKSTHREHTHKNPEHTLAPICCHYVLEI